MKVVTSMVRLLILAGLVNFQTGVTRVNASQQLPDDLPAMPTEEELKFLPPYCKVHPNLDGTGNYASSETEREISAKWESVIGEGYQHLHHYCWALSWTIRANRNLQGEERDSYLRSAVGDFDYVIQNVPSGFILLPEIHVRKGLVWVLRQRLDLAAKEYLTAIRLLPDYAPAYSALSDCYVELNDLDEAQKVLEQGLKQSPESELLKKRLAEIQEKRGKGIQ